MVVYRDCGCAQRMALCTTCVCMHTCILVVHMCVHTFHPQTPPLPLHAPTQTPSLITHVTHKIHTNTQQPYTTRPYQWCADTCGGQSLPSQCTLQHIRTHKLGVSGAAVEGVVFNHIQVWEELNQGTNLCIFLGG